MNFSVVSDSQQNFNVLRGLAMQLQKIVKQENQKCWGKPLGSASLWNENVQTIQRIQDIATHIEIREVSWSWHIIQFINQFYLDFLIK